MCVSLRFSQSYRILVHTKHTHTHTHVQGGSSKVCLLFFSSLLTYRALVEILRYSDIRFAQPFGLVDLIARAKKMEEREEREEREEKRDGRDVLVYKG